ETIPSARSATRPRIHRNRPPPLPPARRHSDRKPVKILGWVACLLLAGSLTYAFVRCLRDGPQSVAPWLFGFQTPASLLFLLYSAKLGNRIFVVANAVALLNAVGIVLVGLAG